MVRYYRIRATSDLLLTILYMVVSLRITPNLENALLFAAVNIKGPVGKDLKKIAWDLSIRKFTSADEALETFANKWRQENEEFSEAIDIIRTSMLRPEAQRYKMFEEAINLILERNSERMKKYTAELSMPVTIINYMGVTLPVLTVILFPILTIFMSQTIKPSLLVFTYNILLPVIVVWLMDQTMKSRPYSFGGIDVSIHPEAHKIGTYRLKIGKKEITIPLFIVSGLFGGFVSAIGIILVALSREQISFDKIAGGLLILWGVALSIIVYSFFSYVKNIKIRDTIRATEGEFTTALYELGLVLSAGYSVESGIEKLIGKIKNLKISDLFVRAIDNIKRFGLTFEKAIFDKELGVIKYYPSQLIKNILKIFVESMQKGARGTSLAIISISNYLKSVRKVEEYLREILSETTSEMRFMMHLLVPVACGVVVGLAALLTSVLVQLAQIFATITGLSKDVPFSSPTMLGVMVDIKRIIPIEWFIVIVGGYMIEVLISLAYFVSILQYGEDPLEKFKNISNSLFMGMILFSITTILIYLFFGGLVKFGPV
jgi:hypothetical protein